MPKSLILLIRKKTRVPTKYQSNHMWRSDWVKVGKISYAESISIFRSINGTGSIITEAEFAYLLYTSYGPGIYHINAWRKGTVGIISFIYLELTPEGFRRMQKNITKEEKEKQDDIKELRKLKKQIVDTSGEEKQNLQEDIEDLKEGIGFDRELIIALKSNKNIVNQYLIPSKPIYKFHSYEDHKRRDGSNERRFDGVESFY